MKAMIELRKRRHQHHIKEKILKRAYASQDSLHLRSGFPCKGLKRCYTDHPGPSTIVDMPRTGELSISFHNKKIVNYLGTNQ